MTITTYIGSFQYQGKQTLAASGSPADTLQFFGQEEGRVRVLHDTTGGNANVSFKYDYFIKDHLGNTRMVLTDEQQSDKYPAATMETANIATENLYYSKLPETRVALPSGYPSDTTTNPNNYVSKLNAGTGGNKIGPGITLKVMAGDQFSIKVSSWYKTNGTNPGTPANPLTDLLAALIGGVGGLPAGGHPPLAILQANSATISPNVTQFLQDTAGKNINTRPLAFVNWVLFDNQFNYVSSSSGFEQVGSDQELKRHVKTNLPIDKSGYLYIYTSNETPNIDVFFDNLQVTHTRGPLLDENHYYPFGLTMAGISDKAAKMGYRGNKYRFQKQELQNEEFSDGSGLEMYEFKYRFDDPQIGRFWSVDPLADKYVYNSTYAFSENKVTSHVELEGLEAADFRIDRDLQDFQSGKIDSKQLAARLDVRGKADLVALGVSLTSVALGPEETFGIGRFLLRTAESSSEQEAKASQNAPKSQQLQKEGEVTEKPAAGVPKPPKGKGSVPPSQRDPKRLYTKEEKKEMLEKQDDKCAQYGKPKKIDEVDGHHIDRHADGGRTTVNNGAAVCKDCHIQLHQ